MSHFADRLVDRCRARGNALCVGLDPRWDALPLEIRKRHTGDSLDSVAAAFEEFCLRVLDVVAPLVPVVKPQSAFFEACGPEGMAVLQRLLRRSRDLGLITILDGKRNDIASTAGAYADAALGGVKVNGRLLPVWDADALTVNPYLGRDAVEPFLESANRSGGGIFVLVRTSNPGAGLFQDLDCLGQPLYVRIAEAVAGWAATALGTCGLSAVGAVVGATYPAELAALRELLPTSPFLVPGFGAQGATAEDTAGAFLKDGLGAVVNSSRGILFPYRPEELAWEAAIERATRETIASLAAATSMGLLQPSRP